VCDVGTVAAGVKVEACPKIIFKCGGVSDLMLRKLMDLYKTTLLYVYYVRVLYTKTPSNLPIKSKSQ
jgi:hypothetical protein